MNLTDSLVDYETFGAQGDGVADDLEAICKATRTPMRMAWRYARDPMPPIISVAGR